METIQSDSLLTSFEVASLLQVDPSTVVKWVNSGKLHAFKTPGGHRRVQAKELVAFLRRHGMYMPPELGGSGSARRVLMVDDDARLLAALQRSFKKNPGIELHTSTNGIDALLSLGELKPDMLVIDVQMPGLDGFAVLERLKSNPATNHLEVVMITGKGSAEVVKRARQLGARTVLIKPFSAADLLNVLLSSAEPQSHA
jgi:excisionase family DNA binding protein